MKREPATSSDDAVVPALGHKLISIPNFKKEVIALFKSHGPWWMLAALVVVSVPLWGLGLAALIHAVADLIRALHG